MNPKNQALDQTHHITSLAETAVLAHHVASTLLPPTLTTAAGIALPGQLGAGKTPFTLDLIAALGGNPRDVSSPTYTLLHLYQTPRFPVYHIDAYRTANHSPGHSEVADFGFDELLDQPALILIEWADRCRDLLPPTTLHIHITHPDNPDTHPTHRTFHLTRTPV